MISVRVNGTMKEAESKRAVGDLYNEEDTDGRARVTTDEERVLQYMCTEQRSSCV